MQRICFFIFFQAAAKCVVLDGFFLDFSKDDMYNNEYIGMSFLEEQRSYMTVDVLNIFRPEFSGDRKVRQELIYNTDYKTKHL